MNIALAMFPKVHGVQTLDNWIFFFFNNWTFKDKSGDGEERVYHLKYIYMPGCTP